MAKKGIIKNWGLESKARAAIKYSRKGLTPAITRGIDPGMQNAGCAKASNIKNMILSDTDIRRYMAEGKIKIDPAPDFGAQLGPCSLDLRLGNNFKMFKPTNYSFVDVKNNYNGDLMEEVNVGDGCPFIIQPREFVIAVTMETITLTSDLMGRLDGRSSLGRLGLVVHSTAARFDPGWTGKAVMEFGNLGIRPIILYAGMRICAMTFETLSSPSGVPYTKQKDHKYAGQSVATGSKITEEPK